MYRPFVLTARDDHKVGQQIGSGSLSGKYAHTALRFDYNTTNVLQSVTNVRVMYASKALEFVGGDGHDVRHAQFIDCGTAVNVDGGRVTIRNALGWNLTNALAGASSSTSTGLWEHATLNQVTNLVSAATGYFTNSLLVGIVDTNGLAGSPNSVVASSNGVFAAVGGGAAYLADDTYRNLASSNIQAQLAQELRQRTTYKPLVLTNFIRVNSTLAPQAGRDTDTLDMGWHYSPIDWWSGGVTVSNVTLTLTNGVCVSIDYVSNAWGFILKSANFLSVGSPTLYNRVVRADTAQEKSGGNPGTRACFYDGASSGVCKLQLRFTDFTQLANGGYMVYVGTLLQNFELTHSRFHNSLIVVEGSGTSLACGITNSLFERSDVAFNAADTSEGAVVHLRNNLFRYRVLHLTGDTTWTIRDNLFDSLSSLTDNGFPVENSYNGYFNTAWGLSGGSNNTNLTSLSYQVGALGNYYQPTNSVLINLGSQNATNAGLYHWCVTTNSVKETNSVVDIGLHYVAVDASGQPQDTDSDGIPDYLEDANGNGAVDSGETDWQNVGDSGLRVYITRPRDGSNVP
jgi:hypothetical protein